MVKLERVNCTLAERIFNETGGAFSGEQAPLAAWKRELHFVQIKFTEIYFYNVKFNSNNKQNFISYKHNS